MGLIKRSTIRVAAAPALLASALLLSSPSPATAEVHKCKGKVATIVGTEGNDVLNGTSGNDVIVSLGGDDEIVGGKGDDLICSGDGEDTIHAGRGNDEVRSGSGKDEVWGDEGDDRLFGGGEGDYVNGGAGKDRLFGGPGNDNLNGENGNDRLYGQGGNDNLSGGESGDDFLSGGPGHDELSAQNGKNRLFGGPGNDELTFGWTGDPQQGRGGGGNDVLRGSWGPDELRGNGGNDTIYGEGGKDVIIVNGGNNTVDAGGGIDKVFFGKGHHTVAIGALDSIRPITDSRAARLTATVTSGYSQSGGRGVSIVGGNGPDVITLDTYQDQWNFVNTRGGDDVIAAGNSFGDYWGGTGTDTITGTGDAFCGGGRFFNDVLKETVTISPQEPGDSVSCPTNYPNGHSWSYADLQPENQISADLQAGTPEAQPTTTPSTSVTSRSHMAGGRS